MSDLTGITYPCKFDRTMQNAMCQPAEGNEPRPLMVALHTWSYTYQGDCTAYAKICAERNWHLIFPDFRGPNWTPAACGSDAVVSDLEDAVSYMKQKYQVDAKRIYLVGGSGGGHCSLLMAGRRPDLWTAVSAWCPISDIALWHKQTAVRYGEAYARHIALACSGDPNVNPSAIFEAKLRSPLTWLSNAADIPVDISTGIHDGHTGSVPVGQAIRAYNKLAAPADRISEEDIRFMEENEKIPSHLAAAETDPAFGKYTVYLRKQSGNARLTLFEGGHDMLPEAAAEWLAKQVSGQKADWTSGKAAALDSAHISK